MTGPVSTVAMALTFAAGLALFMFGTGTLGAGLRRAAGGRIRKLISAVTGNRLTAMLAGALATVAVQSSGLVMVTLIGLVQSRLVTFTASLGIILGAEIGTTAMAQLIAFAPGDYSLQIFAAGFLLSMFRRRPEVGVAGEVLMGIGLLFFGIRLMGTAVSPLRSHPGFPVLIASLQHPLAGVLVGFGVTALIQSSSAFMGILIALATQGAITLEASIALMFGSNIGSCVMAAFGSLGAIRPAKRVFLAQLMFNVAGAAVFMLLIPPFADLVRMISPSDAGSGLARQIANAHTLYNLMLALLYLPVLDPYARLIERLLPDDPQEMGKIPFVRHLRDSALGTPLIALDLSRAEAARMTTILCRMTRALLHPFMRRQEERDLVYGDLTVVEGLRMREEKLDYLDRRITEYLIRIMKEDIGADEMRQTAALMTIVKELEGSGDVVESLLDRLQREPGDSVENLTPEGLAEIGRLHEQVCLELSVLAPAVRDMDSGRARAVLSERPAFEALFHDLEFSHMMRLRRLRRSEVSHDLHMELLLALETIHGSVMAVAGTIVKTGDNGKPRPVA